MAGAVRLLILEGIPQLSSSNYNEAKRFVTLIDTLYEAKVRLICSAADTPERLYIEGEGSFEFARTASRPVASGRVSRKLAWGWLLALSLVGLIVLLQLRWQAQAVALGSLALVAAYPFMKRITWWPQAWLGMVFNWGLLVGWTDLRWDNWDALACVYAGCIAWVIGYDTIYALQDREDDAMVGIRSSALAMGARPEIVLDELRALGATGIVADLADVPPLDTLDPDTCHIGWRLELPPSVTEAQVEDVFLFVDAEWKLTRLVVSDGSGFDFQLGTMIGLDREQRQVVLAPLFDENGEEILSKK